MHHSPHPPVGPHPRLPVLLPAGALSLTNARSISWCGSVRPRHRSYFAVPKRLERRTGENQRRVERGRRGGGRRRLRKHTAVFLLAASAALLLNVPLFSSCRSSCIHLSARCSLSPSVCARAVLLQLEPGDRGDVSAERGFKVTR